MGIQQMLLRSRIPKLSADVGNITTSFFQPEPAPQTSVVSVTAPANASGGTGSYTYTWSIVSGSAAITSSTSASFVTLQATLFKNTIETGVVRCVVSDGVSSFTANRNYSLGYTTDL